MIRNATLQDRPHFLRLWSAYLREQQKEGSHLLADNHNLYRFLGFFESYVTGARAGVCPLAIVDEKVVGLCMGGELLSLDEWHTDLGRIFTFWGIYVEPEYRGQHLSGQLFSKCLESGLELGADTVETYVRTANKQGQGVARLFGTHAYIEQHIADLRGPEVLKGVNNG